MFSIETGFRFWHIEISKEYKSKPVPISCFPKDLSHFSGVATSTEIFEIINGQEIPWPKDEKLIFWDTDYERFLKCVARDRTGQIISSQLYIITPRGKH